MTGNDDLPDRHESARADEALADRQVPPSGKAETEGNPPCEHRFVKGVRHAAEDAAPRAEPAGRGIGRDVAHGVDEPLLSIQKEAQAPAGVVPHDLPVCDGHDGEPAVRVALELPLPLFGGHFGPERARKEPSDPGRVGGRGGTDLDAHRRRKSAPPGSAIESGFFTSRYW